MASTSPPVSIATIRERLIALDAAHANGALVGDAYHVARRAAEQALAAAVLADPAPVASVAAAASAASAASSAPAAASTRPPAPTIRPSRRLVAALALAVVAVAVGGYAFTGSPSLAGLGAPPAPPAAAPETADNDRSTGIQQIAGMVDKLAARLKEQPDDAEGWTMLARSYTVLMRYRDAIPAYERALQLQPKNAGLMADYADAMAAANDGHATAASTALIDRALTIDPTQPKALALAGTIAFERGDYATAVAQWQKIADALPPGTEFYQQVVANIDEARRRGGMPAAPARSAANTVANSATTAATTAAATPAAAPVAAPVAAGRETLTGVVSLDPALASKVSPNDTVFVLARPEAGRMPLAVFRATVKDLPLRFKLDDSMAMTPTMKISDHKHVVVAARISKSGNAISQPGDISGEIGPVAPGTSDLKIVIANVVPAR